MRTNDWLSGIGAATWLFLPIGASSIDSKPIMMWRPLETIELLAAWLLVAAVLAVSIRISRARVPRALRAAAISLAVAPAAVTILDLNARWLAAQFQTPTGVGVLVLLAGAGAVAGLLIAALRDTSHALGHRSREFLRVSAVLAIPFWMGVLHLQSGPLTPTLSPVPGERGAPPIVVTSTCCCSTNCPMTRCFRRPARHARER